jgi:chromate transporter
MRSLWRDAGGLHDVGPLRAALFARRHRQTVAALHKHRRGPGLLFSGIVTASSKFHAEAAGEGLAASARTPTPLREWLSVWPLLALISFGSNAVQLAAMHRVLVEGKRWISERRFLNALNYCFALPGPEAQLLATYIGWLMHRTIGGVTAGVLFVLPGTICMMAMSYGYVAGGKSDLAEAVFFGLKPAVLVIVVQSLVRVGTRFLRSRLMLVLAAAAFIATYLFNLPFGWIVIASVLAGLITGLLGIRALLASASTARAFDGASEELGSDKLADHTRPSAIRSVQTIALWLGLWLIPIAAIVAIAGWENVFSRIAILFSGVSFLWVGGPYAVNSYVAVDAVETYAWLTHSEVLDGFAMAELAPGSAVQFLQFVGFLAAYRNPGMLNPNVAAALGGLLAVWVTFIPTFLWMFLVAPFIELYRGSKLLDTTLSALTGATLGVILSFAVSFGARALFGQFTPVSAYGLDFNLPNVASIDPWALFIAVVAAVAIFQLKLGIVPTLAAAAAIGFIPHLLAPALSGSIRAALLGFVAGAAIGFPAGPMAVWCLHLRIHKRWAMHWAIIAGSAIGDLVLAGGFVVIAGLFGHMLPALTVLQNPLVQGPALILSGIALFFIVTRSALLGLPEQAKAQEPKWSYAGAGVVSLIALTASITHPENLLTITAVFAVLGIPSDGGVALLAGFFLGSLAMWAGSIELLAHLGQKQGRQIMLRVMQLLCALCILAGIVQLGRAFDIFAGIG